ncbi:hypothetical protein KCU89_g18061, partial [Aureobasidium melanogenum]
SLHKGFQMATPQRTFKFPGGSGPVSAVRAMPNGRHLICASYDILRLYDLRDVENTRSTVPFLIVPGHRTGVISALHIDPASQCLSMDKKSLSLSTSFGDKTKRTAAGIPTWSPTVVLICRSTAYVWQSGRDAQFSADCG